MNFTYAQRSPLVPILIGAISGIVCDRYCPQPSMVYWFMIVFCSLLLLSNRHRFAIKLGVALFVVTVFALLHHFDWWSVEPDDFAIRIPNQQVVASVEGQLESAVEFVPAAPADALSAGKSKPRVQFLFRVSRTRQFVNGHPTWIRTTGMGMVSCTVDSESSVNQIQTEYRRGISIRILARCYRYSHNLNPGQWDAADFYWDRRLSFHAHCQDPGSMRILDQSSPAPLLAHLDDLRMSMLSNLRQHLSDRSFAIAAAIVLGNRHYLGTKRMQTFMCTGTIHLFAISGLHVGILALVITFPIRFFPGQRTVLLCLAVVLIWIYALLTGGRPPVIRASILVTIISICSVGYRTVLPANSLALAGIVILVLNPSTLFQIGTQLSFLATAALFTCRALFLKSRLSDPLLMFVLRSQPFYIRFAFSGLRSIGVSVVYTTAMWLVCTPLVAHGFHMISLVGILLNVVLSIPVACVYTLTLLLAIFAEVPVIGASVSMLCEAAIELLNWLVETTEKADFGFWWAAGPTTAWLIIFYLALASAVLLLGAGHLRRTTCAVMGMFVVISICIWPGRVGLNHWIQQREYLGIHFISVGHGTSVLMEQPNGENWLYDAGSLTRSEFAGRVIADVLWNRGHSHLDGIYISHADLDHFNAVSYLAERFAFSICRTTPRMRQQLQQATASSALGIVWHQLNNQLVKVESVTVNDRWSLGLDGWVSVLSPRVGEQHQSDNEASLVLALSVGKQRILLPGDIEEDTILRLINRENGNFDVLMLPHHGSQHSAPEKMALWCRPQVVVVSTGHHRLPPEVQAIYEQAVADRHGALYVTSEQGMIHVEVRGSGITASPLIAP